MAPYNPPNTHYSQMDVSMYEEDDIFKFIGKNGKKFYWLTRYLDLSYMWYDKERRVIELWGPYESLQYFSFSTAMCGITFIRILPDFNTFK